MVGWESSQNSSGVWIPNGEKSTDRQLPRALRQGSGVRQLWVAARQPRVQRSPGSKRPRALTCLLSLLLFTHWVRVSHWDALSNSHMVMRRRAESCQEKLPNLKRSTCWLNLALYKRDFNSNLFSLLCSVWYWPFFVLEHFSWTPLIECCPIWHKGKEFVRSHNGSFLC